MKSNEIKINDFRGEKKNQLPYVLIHQIVSQKVKKLCQSNFNLVHLKGKKRSKPVNKDLNAKG